MTHSNQTNGIEQGAALVRHNRPIKGVLKFPLPRDIPEVWFQIFLPKKSDRTMDTSRIMNQPITAKGLISLEIKGRGKVVG